MAAVELEGIVKRYGEALALAGVDLEARDKALTVIVGPSGCGKSTALKLIAGLEDPDAGTIRIGGRVVNRLAPAKRDVAMVFQAYALYPHMSVFDNMAFPLRMARQDKATIAARVREVAELLHLEDLLGRKPAALSGGQQQRVAMGRAMVRDPAVTLFDEPLSNLDAQLRIEMREELVRLQRRLEATMIFVTHDQIEAMTLADTIVVLNAGRVEQSGPPRELYEHPANRFVAGFIGAPSMNFLEAEVAEAPGDALRLALSGGATLELPTGFAGLRAGDAVALGIRPEHLRLEAEAPGPRLPARVGRSEHLGAQTLVHLETAAGPLRRLCGEESGVTEGERVSVALPPERCHLFDADGRALERR
ncbi:MAG TPA: ABC transporter ATP-binding protein [Kiloniellales bacterium]|nr:ABC transporter ATP-binding protein [Kiloniellales bacterium]